MTVRVWRWLIFTAVVAPCFGIASGAPPAPDRKSGGEDPSVERARLQAKLLKMLETMSPPPTSYPPAPAPGAAKGPTKTETGSGGSKSIDPIREATNYFRDNDFEGARRTFQLIDPATLGAEDRAYVRYMLACSCRRMGKITEATDYYREVANSTADEFLANCAVWQLSLIKADQELQAQLEQLRSRAKNK
ncbi:hypothetical protein [Frigoriglobus tundricola]|uniref:Tetratricopeptide repeat protein n=1 Tax=Frigoriglobus tundricola TaxID=2774151 RepID=A0A6M5YM19_9BACT|nr:hypothetical protein [Frigoriglobus tundricola]QJW94376.1 hypothetical protein FTUN_1896 [Frigoriglobus tundricola]